MAQELVYKEVKENKSVTHVTTIGPLKGRIRFDSSTGKWLVRLGLHTYEQRYETLNDAKAKMASIASIVDTSWH